MELAVKLKKQSDGATYTITEALASARWSGSDEQVSRSLEFSLLNAPNDENLKKVIPAVALGDAVSMYTDGTLRFYGMVTDRETLSENGVESFTAYDMLYHLTKSTWNRNFKNKTAEQIAKACCKEAGITFGSGASSGTKVEKVIAKEITIYDTLAKAYKKVAKKTGSSYKIMMDGKKMTVIEKGMNLDRVILSDLTNITDASIDESAADIINRVKIYNDKGKKIGTVSDSDSVKKYGVFEAVYTKEKGVAATAGAKQQYNKPTQELRVSAIGDIACISGYSVEVKDAATGMSGTYWIKEDSHNFENGTYTMELTLKKGGKTSTTTTKKKTASEKKEMGDVVSSLAKKVVKNRAKHVSGSYRYKKSKVNCSVFVSACLQEMGLLAKNKTLSHTSRNHSKRTLSDVVVNRSKVKGYTWHKTNARYSKLPASYRKTGCIYLYESSIAIKGKDAIYGCHSSGRTYTGMGMVKHKSGDYEYSHEILAVGVPKK